MLLENICLESMDRISVEIVVCLDNEVNCNFEFHMTIHI